MNITINCEHETTEVIDVAHGEHEDQEVVCSLCGKVIEYEPIEDWND